MKNTRTGRGSPAKRRYDKGSANGHMMTDMSLEGLNLYRTLAEAARDMIYIIGRDVSIIYVNSSAAEALGMAPQDVIGKKMDDFFPESVARRQERKLRHVFETCEPMVTDDTTLLSGREYWLNTHLVPIRDREGNVSAVMGISRDITERKLGEKAFQESEKRFRQLIESSPVAIVIYDKNEDIEFLNKKFIDTFGYDMKHLRNVRDWWTLAYPEEPYRKMIFDQWSAEVKKCMEEGATETRHIENIVRCADDSYRTMETVGALIGEKVLVIFNDITERKDSEESLRKLSRAVEESTAVIVITDLHGNVEYVNPMFTRLTGYSFEEIKGKNPNILKSGETTREEYERIWNTILSGCQWKGEFHNKKKNGDFYWESAIISPIKDAGGRITHFIAVKEDITDRKRDEAELLRVNRALKAISKCNEAMIHADEEYALLNEICDIVVDIGGYRMAWIGYAENDEHKTVRPVSKTGYEEGYIDKARITWADTEYGRGPTGTAIRTGKYNVARNILVDPNFKPWRKEASRRGYASVLGLPLTAGGRTFGALTIYSERTDAFDRNEIILLQELADNLAYGITSIRSRIRKEQAEKALMDAKAQSEIYLDLMGHDINNMNQIALGFLELALDSPSLDEHVKELISKPVEALESSTELITNVRRLQQAKEGSFLLQRTDVGSVLDEVLSKYTNIPGRDITITRHFECDCHTMANGLLNDVFSNIVGNSVKHSKGPVTIDVGLKMAMLEGIKYCAVTIGDNGPGISDEMKGKLLNRFRQGINTASGKGLGLYLVKTLVDDFHGYVWIEDRVPGDHTKGCEFIVMLPVAEE